MSKRRPPGVQPPDDAPREAGHGALDVLSERAGGPARGRVVVLLGAVLALSSADVATIGALAAELERNLHISNTQVGLLAAVGTGVGALATLPVGLLTDRVRRVRLLAGSVALWSVAMVASGAAVSFGMLVVTRMFLGAVTATAGPTLASLVGDLFPGRERARIYGWILSGEFFGAGIGFVASGVIAGVLSWRFAFWFLAIPSAVLAYALRRMLPEPARGGQSRLEPGADRIVAADEVEDDDVGTDVPSGGDESDERMKRVVGRQGVQPDPSLVLDEDPVGMPLWEAVRYVLRVATNRVLILSSALGYFFLAGVQTFLVLLLRARYGLGQSSASAFAIVIGLGAVAGVVLGGRLADRLVGRGRATARIDVPVVGYVAAAGILLPGLLSGSLAVSLPLFALGALALATTNPPLDAARLDIMHPRLWGRAESVRTVLRMVATALAPIVFGVISDAFGGHVSFGAPGSAQSLAGAVGLQRTFLILLTALLVAGLILVWARRTYPRDVATAIASIQRIASRRRS